jgi:beta-galactosidase
VNTALPVSLEPGCIRIEGHPQILLTSSLFYFRIPAPEWRSRMRTLRSLGYNAIDVYFPWNYHELAPGHWDFSGQRDAEAFLQQAKEEGLWVVARPGPYICSEWDGGALPAWLFADEAVRVRDNAPAYLDAVRTWYDRIMPLLARYQLGRDGTVVLLQLENELDFFECGDRAGMMAALRDMALSHGIAVPLVACAGQGDIAGATGDVEGIVPACNVYFDRRDPQLEVRIRHYEQRLRRQGYPLCITETNRSHAELRRLMLGGAKLLGPYLQAGGTDFGFTTSINNWGQPLSFATTHYDFGGMISPGGKVRAEGKEAIILAKVLEALGPALALAVPEEQCPLMMAAPDGAWNDRVIEGHALALDGGGYLVGLPNTGEAPVRVTWDAPVRLPQHISLEVGPNTCPFLLLDLPLERWGITGGRLAYATAELVECVPQESGLRLTLAADEAAELMLAWPGAAAGDIQGWRMEPQAGGWRLWVEGGLPAMAEFAGVDGRHLRLCAVARTDAGSLRTAGVEQRLIAPVKATAPMDVDVKAEADGPLLHWRQAPIDPCGEGWFVAARACLPDRLHLEQNDIWRGFGWYRAGAGGEQVGRAGVQGLLVLDGADVLSLYAGARFLGTCVPGGGAAFVPLPPGATAEGDVIVRAEIWGHSNFDDDRLPALRLQSRRGLGGLVAVRSARNITPNWYYQHKVQEPASAIDPRWPLIYFGGWSSTDEPLRGVYYQELTRAEDMEACILHFEGLEASAQIFVDGRWAGPVNPLNPYVNVSRLVQPGATAILAIALEQDYRRPAGQVVLYQGTSVRDWCMAGWEEEGLARLAQESWDASSELDAGGGAAAQPSVQMAGGAMAWLHAELPQAYDWECGFQLQFAGHGVKATVLLGERVVGRVWLPSDMRPRMAGGADDRVVLPATWVREAGGRVHLLLESVSPAGELQSVRVTTEG